MEVTLDDLMTAARTVYGEARGETFLGQTAVAWVIMNRWKDRSARWKKDSTLTKTCLRTAQFSCWFDHNKEKCEAADVNDRQLRSCLQAVLVAIDGLHDPTHGAYHYHANGINPKWAHGKIPVRIGNHAFYNDIE